MLLQGRGGGRSDRWQQGVRVGRRHPGFLVTGWRMMSPSQTKERVLRSTVLIVLMDRETTDAQWEGGGVAGEHT